MNVTQFINFKDFNHPPLEPIFVPRSFAFIFLNVFSLGIYGDVVNVMKGFQIKKLDIQQNQLLEKVANLADEWDALEEQLTTLMKKMNSKDKAEIVTLQERIDGIEKDSIILKNRRIVIGNDEQKVGITKIAIGIIAFVGHLIANILTIGFYGIYQNYTLKNRVNILEAYNDHIQNQTVILIQQRFEALEKQINLLREGVILKEENEGFVNTTPEDAQKQVEEAQKRQAELQEELKKNQADYQELKIQKVAFELAENQAKQALSQERKQLNQEKNRQYELNSENQQIRKVIQNEQNKNNRLEKERKNLERQLNEANVKAARVKDLEEQIQRLREAPKNPPDLQQLKAELGPLPLKYTPRKDIDKEIAGAMDVEKMDDERVQQLDPTWVNYANAFNQRYGKIQVRVNVGDGFYYEPKKLYTAVEVAKAGFNFAFNELIEMAETGNKIKLNKGIGTAYTVGAQTVYRYMVLDWIKGGKIHMPDCHGFVLQINEDVAMYPSQPEKVLRYKKDPDGASQPKVIVHYKRQDGFTPAVEILEDAGIKEGVDPVGAKWIYAQLTEKEKEHLFNLLMAPVIENNNEEYQKTREFMRHADHPRVRLVSTANDLIAHMGIALDKKFGPNIFIQCWETHAADKAVNPFVKEEDLQPGLSKVVDLNIIQAPKRNEPPAWELDLEVLKAGGNHFTNLILEAKTGYQTIFECMNSNLLVKAYTKNHEFNKLEWDVVNAQYHVSHLIGDRWRSYSNLLAVLLIDKKELNKENVKNLQKAMAAYLDKLKEAKQEWEKIKNSPGKAKDSDKLKELADLADAFEASVQDFHMCSLAAYQLGLRGKPAQYIDGEWIQPVKVRDNFSSFEVQLAAFTIGVRIGILPINLEIKTKVDEHGRILPLEEVYGPNTVEILLMARTNQDFYGLYPKLNLEEKEYVLSEELELMANVERYWKGIDEA